MLNYYKSIFFFLNKDKFIDCPYLQKKEHQLFIYTLSLIPKLWNKKHYRNPTLQKDLLQNLSNVILPGTNIYLSFFVKFKFFYYIFIFYLYPLYTLIYSIYTFSSFYDNLFFPDEWITYWQINSIVSTLHYYNTKDKAYKLENKFKFLQEAEKINLPVTPSIKSDIILKDKNMEGGLGINVIRNAFNNGNIVIQKLMYNNDYIKKLLPKNAALSTFRVLTINYINRISVLTSVWRAAMQNTITDHSNIMFNIDNNNNFDIGVTNDNWYSKFKINKNYYRVHPESNKLITGLSIPCNDLENIKKICVEGHTELLNNIPIVGWDVALTSEGIMILECNLSCNLFYGKFNKKIYFELVETIFRSI